ncbi:MAG: DNA adenine methylase [archaeon]
MNLKPFYDRRPTLIKYPGGKHKELKYILPELPHDSKRFFEPFVGGGAVYFNVNAEYYFINDKSQELMDFYDLVAQQDHEFINRLEKINDYWKKIGLLVDKYITELVDLYESSKTNKQRERDYIFDFIINHSKEFNGLLSPDFNVELVKFTTQISETLSNKFSRMKSLEMKKGTLTDEDLKKNILSSMKAALYTHFRYLYNHSEALKLSKSFKIALYYFIREFCYSSMFRYNANGEFNVPFGGISYAKKALDIKLNRLKSSEIISQLNKTQKEAMDFEEFLNEHPPNSDDFIFVDPPYDTSFSTYAKNTFDKNDQERLANFLINKTKAKFMIVIKNTDFIKSIYPEDQVCANGNPIKIIPFNKKYFVSFQNRNNKNAEHLIIKNY